MKRLVCGVAAALMMTGCAQVTAPEWSNPVSTGVPAPVEPVEVVETHPQMEQEWAFGEAVWAVQCGTDMEPYVIRYAVVAQIDGLVAVIPWHGATGEELYQDLVTAAMMPVDEYAHLYLVRVADCYDSETAAWAAVEDGYDGM